MRNFIKNLLLKTIIFLGISTINAMASSTVLVKQEGTDKSLHIVYSDQEVIYSDQEVVSSDQKKRITQEDIRKALKSGDILFDLYADTSSQKDYLYEIFEQNNGAFFVQVLASTNDTPCGSLTVFRHTQRINVLYYLYSPSKEQTIACEKSGFNLELIELSDTTKKKSLTKKIPFLNQRITGHFQNTPQRNDSKSDRMLAQFYDGKCNISIYED